MRAAARQHFARQQRIRRFGVSVDHNPQFRNKFWSSGIFASFANHSGRESSIHDYAKEAAPFGAASLLILPALLRTS
jgi:hypothetical protein